jgi:hypothetical protein
MSQELSHIDAAIADLEAWRERIEAAIQTLRQFAQGSGGVPSSPPPPGSGRPAHKAELAHDTFFQMTIPDAAEKYLGIVKCTKPNPELSEALLKGGLKSSAKMFGETVRAVLSRDERFVKVNGEWGLASWYPAMRKDRKAKTPEPATTVSTPAPDAKAKPKGGAFPADSIKGRTIKTLDDSPQKYYSPNELAQILDVKTDTLRAALTELFKRKFIARPEEGKYQSIKGQSAAA